MTEYSEASLLRALQNRRLLYWRIAAIVCFLFACVVSIGNSGLSRHEYSAVFISPKPHIARVVIKGIIRNDVSALTNVLDKARQSSSVRGLLLIVDSPGGGVTGGERLHDAIARFAAVKPVVVSMGDMGASAAYMLSVPAQHIVARPSTLTGSIGVIMQRPDLSGLLSRWGITVDAVISGAMKDQTDPTSPLTSQGRLMLQGLVDDLFGQFVQMVADGRHLSVDRVRELADGRPYTGHQALERNLVDALGDEEDATAWLRTRLGVAKDYPIMSLLSASRNSRQHWYDLLFSNKRGSIIEYLLGSAAENSLEQHAAGLLLDGPVAILQF